MKEFIKTSYGSLCVKLNNSHLDEAIVFLHGWLLSLDTFDSCCEELKEYATLQIDFSGFGKSDSPVKKLTLYDYVQMTKEVIDILLKNKKITLVGHSFGGRVAILYSSLYQTKMVFLVNTKAFKNKSLKLKMKVYSYKLKKLILFFISKKKLKYLKENSGSKDYKDLTPVMKQTMTNIIKFDLKRKLRKLNSKTIVIGSINDSVVKYKETLNIYKNIKNATLYTFYNSDHFCYISEFNKFINILRKELKHDN